VWQAAAPHIDWLSPDIYNPEFVHWCQEYRWQTNPLFIPEANRGDSCAALSLFAFAELGAIGFSPFAVERIADKENSTLARCYQILKELTPNLIDARQRGEIHGFALTQDEREHRLELHGVTVRARHDLTWEWASGDRSQDWPLATGLLIRTGPLSFLAAGSGLIFEFLGRGSEQVGIVSVDERSRVDGHWTKRRRLNGDENHQGRHLRLPLGDFGIQEIELYSYK
jgi:hypothetical protein